jgi:Fe-S cluster biosynthesis and repair protein YggX
MNPGGARGSFHFQAQKETEGFQTEHYNIGKESREWVETIYLNKGGENMYHNGSKQAFMAPNEKAPMAFNENIFDMGGDKEGENGLNFI